MLDEQYSGVDSKKEIIFTVEEVLEIVKKCCKNATRISVPQFGDAKSSINTKKAKEIIGKAIVKDYTDNEPYPWG